MDLSDIMVGESKKEVIIKYKDKDYRFVFKPMSWRAKNKILSRSIFSDGKKMQVDTDLYYSLALKEMLIEAPWPLNETQIHLGNLIPAFGQKLQEFIPAPFESDMDDESKKGLGEL